MADGAGPAVRARYRRFAGAKLFRDRAFDRAPFQSARPCPRIGAPPAKAIATAA
jgi:hypothetical protein